MILPELKLVPGVISLRSFWEKYNFISGHKISCKQHPKGNQIKGNICACVSKNDWLLLNRPFISDHPRNEIHFISPTMKSNVNRIPFMVGWNFISSLIETPSKRRYHFHVATHVMCPWSFISLTSLHQLFF